jgi:hypothetical protein
MKHTRKPELQTVTVEFGGGLDSGLCWGKLTVLFLVTSNRCTSVYNTLGRSEVAFCASNIIQLSSVVSAAHKLDFRLVIQGTP